MTEERDPVDKVLDRALTHYGRSEPRPGLEGRLLARLREVQTQPPCWAWLRGRAPWGFAAAGLALVLTGALFFWFRPAGEERHVRGPVAPGEAAPAPPPATVVAAAVESPEPQPAARADRRPARRRAAAFPEPTPLSDQEQLLLAYISVTPSSELEERTGFLDAPAALPELSDTRPNP